MRKKLLIALSLATLAMVSVFFYSRSLEQEAVGGAKISVLVAAGNIPAGTRLARSQLAQRRVPEAYMNKAFIHTDEENTIVGTKAIRNIAPGEDVLWSDIEVQRAAATHGLAAAVPTGMRAFTLPVDASGALAGLLRPSDHVDIMGTFARAQNGADYATVTLLQNVLVLATGDVRGDGEESLNGAHSFGNITVAVDLEEAELLAFCAQRGPLSIALRNKEDMEIIEGIPDKNFGDVFEAQKRSAFVHRRLVKNDIQRLKPL
jgi:pilus assembly protein CpaB